MLTLLNVVLKLCSDSLKDCGGDCRCPLAEEEDSEEDSEEEVGDESDMVGVVSDED